MSLPESKWIDKYLLRYAPSTIFGAFLLVHFYMKRRQLGFDFDLNLDHLALGTVFLFGGFLVAYLASAPVLVFHYSRGLTLSRKRSTWSYLIPVALLLLLTPVTTIYLKSKELDSRVALWASIAFSMWVWTFCLAVYASLKRKDIFRFYSDLSKKRTDQNADFVESYRTLREHGNAFYIIYWEIVLALMWLAAIQAYTVDDSSELLITIAVFILIWITPAAIAWTIAGNLENDFIYDGENQKE